MKHTCEKCSMDATFLKIENGVVHYFCDHHSPQGATRIGQETKPKTGVRKFLPLILIFTAIILFTIISSVINGPFDISFSMRMMMGSFFAIFGLFKIFNLKAFADAYQTYDILAIKSRAYAFVYPFLEILIAVLYITDFGGVYRDIFTFVLMFISSIGVIKKLRQKEEIPCACLGMVFVLPMTVVTLIEDILMALEALAMIIIFAF